MLTPAAITDLLREASRRSPRRCSEAMLHLLRHRPRFTPRHEVGDLREAVLTAVEERGPIRAGHVALVVGRPTNKIGEVFARLVREGRIKRVGRGVYA